MLHRSISEKGGPRVVLWANAAARKAFGQPRDSDDVLQYWSELSDKIKPAAQATLKTLYQKVQVRTVYFPSQRLS